ncbi:hypothetical protein HYFRA_00001251 [Hymenoscyphus fraxineus]|uniref:Uncharacterized protein n=1 Tax=Hymenoscyphus fraxineus TaxID=746836 RepID=A0A9N9L7A6_9HELO|nr:hypothetical protein HYFRA_00001251 [Hymenoscyphus fraxineus]
MANNSHFHSPNNPWILFVNVRFPYHHNIEHSNNLAIQIEYAALRIPIFNISSHHPGRQKLSALSSEGI